VCLKPEFKQKAIRINLRPDLSLKKKLIAFLIQSKEKIGDLKPDQTK